MTMPQLQTSRLRLVALSERQIQLYLDDTSLLEKELGVPLSREVIAHPVPRAIAMKVEAMAAAPEQLHPWYTYWLVIIKSQPSGVGLLGFKGVPDPQGEVEIGYGIDPAFQSEGYTTEAARALIGWAFQHSDCQAVTAQNVLQANTASQRVLAKLCMQVYAYSSTTQDWRIDREPGQKQSPAASAGPSKTVLNGSLGR